MKKAHLQLTARKIVDFKGTLLQALHKPGQKYALLLYRTENGLRYCLSKNIRMVHSMQIGQTYRVKGKEYTTGHKTFLDIITASPLVPLKQRLKRQAGMLAGITGIFIIAGTIGAGFMAQQSSQRSNQTDTPDVTLQREPVGTPPKKAGKVADIIKPQANVLAQPAGTPVAVPAAPTAPTTPKSRTATSSPVVPVPAPTPQQTIVQDPIRPNPAVPPAPPVEPAPVKQQTLSVAPDTTDTAETEQSPTGE